MEKGDICHPLPSVLYYLLAHKEKSSGGETRNVQVSSSVIFIPDNDSGRKIEDMP